MCDCPYPSPPSTPTSVFSVWLRGTMYSRPLTLISLCTEISSPWKTTFSPEDLTSQSWYKGAGRLNFLQASVTMDLAVTSSRTLRKGRRGESGREEGGGEESYEERKEGGGGREEGRRGRGELGREEEGGETCSPVVGSKCDQWCGPAGGPCPAAGKGAGYRSPT